MRNEINLITNFLNQNNYQNFSIKKIAGDASFRVYFRVFFADQKTLIIMSAPPEFEDIKPFYKIDKFLISHDFSAPKILAVDYENGLMLLEDFGDESYSKILIGNAGSDLEKNLYQNAVLLLANLQKISPPQDLAIYDENLLLKEVMLFIDWYLPHIAKKPANADQINQFKNLWLDLFKKISAPSKLVLRDYHADNLMILKNRQTYKNVGLLDFQDAVIGSAAYDLVSLLEDARRDVDLKLQEKIIKYYFDNFDCDQKTFLYDYQVLSLQRNIKIVGIFARLAIRDSKPNYLNLLPRVFGHINIRLQSDLFKELRIFLSTFIS